MYRLDRTQRRQDLLARSLFPLISKQGDRPRQEMKRKMSYREIATRFC
jgi:hypothetical protein